MTAPVEVDRSPLDDLKSALTSGGLGDAGQATGEKLLGRLTSPVRVAILGLPQTGKSTIFNMLAGQVVLPEGMSLPTTQLVWGDAARTTYTLPDATQKVFEGVELEAAASLQPALVKLEMPIEQLKKISLLEVVAGSATTDQQRAMRWASKRADIALWCSTEFDAAEVELWSMMPEALQGHSFLVLSKTDLLSASGDLENRIDDLQGEVEEYFHSLVPLAGREALASMRGDGPEDQQLFASSGGQALISSILREVRAGRRADMDSIEVFLHRYGWAPDEDQPTEHEPAVKEAASGSEPAPGELEASQDSTEAAEPKEEPQPREESEKSTAPGADVSVFAAALELVKSGLEEKAEDHEAFEPDGELTEMPDFDALEEFKAKPAPLTPTGDHNTRQQALKYLSEQARDLAKMVNESATPSDVALIERCVQVADHLGDLVLNDAGEDPSLAGYEQRCQEASELLVLMQLEAEEATPQDAVTVLFQLKREFEERSAV